MAVVGKRWICVHVPRTGGLSMRRALGGKTRGVHAHAPLFHLRELYGNRWAFGFVRNPWDQMVSLYARIIFRGHNKHRVEKAREMGFRKWLLEDTETIDVSVQTPRPFQRLSASWWLDGADFIGRFERLAGDTALVSEKIGKRIVLPHINAAPRDNIADHFDAEMHRFIRAWHGDTIDQFGYLPPK